MSTYKMSNGGRVEKAVLDRRVVRAKKRKLAEFHEINGYYFCEDCGKNDCKPIDCSHDISVKECQESGRSELAWDINNITLRGRRCHNKHDKTC